MSLRNTKTLAYEAVNAHLNHTLRDNLTGV